MTAKYAYPLTPNEQDPKAVLVADLTVADDQPVPQGWVCQPCATKAEAEGLTRVHETPVPPNAQCGYCKGNIHARGREPHTPPLVS